MSNSWHVPTLRGVIGNWVYYPSLMTAQQISERVMPSKDIRESKELDDYLQRELRNRVAKIVRYLKTRDSRFFNSILLGVFDALPEWFEFDLTALAEKLHLGDVAQTKASMGLLQFSGSEKMFAIDGQHRVEAIRKGFSDFPERVSPDQYSVILLAHIDNQEGKVRTRRLFCDINKNAVSVSEGDKVIIDEDELPAIVTRRLYAEYSYFQGSGKIAVTEKKEQVQKAGLEYFTSLLAIHTVCLKLKPVFKTAAKSLPHARENVVKFQEIVTKFFDFIINKEPDLRKYFIYQSTTPTSERVGNKNLAFRPIGLEILARLYAHFLRADKLHLFAWALENLQWRNPKGILDGIVWFDGRIESKAKAKTTAVNFCLYLLHELPEKEFDALLKDLREISKQPWPALPNQAKIPKTIQNQT